MGRDILTYTPHHSNPNYEGRKMLTSLLLNILLVGIIMVEAGPQRQISCAECKHEIHHFGGHIHEKGEEIAQYLTENYCPSLENQHDCPHDLAQWYPHLLQAVVRHYVVDGALLWLELNWCDDEKPMCIPALQRHFVPMHVMVMEKFMIPVEICNEEPVCGGATHQPPTVPPHY